MTDPGQWPAGRSVTSISSFCNRGVSIIFTLERILLILFLTKCKQLSTATCITSQWFWMERQSLHIPASTGEQQPSFHGRRDDWTLVLMGVSQKTALFLWFLANKHGNILGYALPGDDLPDLQVLHLNMWWKVTETVHKLEIPNTEERHNQKKHSDNKKSGEELMWLHTVEERWRTYILK